MGSIGTLTRFRRGSPACQAVVGSLLKYRCKVVYAQQHQCVAALACDVSGRVMLMVFLGEKGNARNASLSVCALCDQYYLRCNHRRIYVSVRMGVTSVYSKGQKGV